MRNAEVFIDGRYGVARGPRFHYCPHQGREMKAGEVVYDHDGVDSGGNPIITVIGHVHSVQSGIRAGLDCVNQVTRAARSDGVRVGRSAQFSALMHYENVGADRRGVEGYEVIIEVPNDDSGGGGGKRAGIFPFLPQLKLSH